MNAKELAAIKAGDEIGIARYLSSFLSFHLTTVSKVTATQIVIRTPQPVGEDRVRRFNRNTGHEIGSSYSRTFLISLAEAQAEKEHREAVHKSAAQVRTLEGVNWKYLDNDQRAQIIALVEEFKKTREGA